MKTKIIMESRAYIVIVVVIVRHRQKAALCDQGVGVVEEGKEERG
jgi:hypothetical protein